MHAWFVPLVAAHSLRLKKGISWKGNKPSTYRSLSALKKRVKSVISATTLERQWGVYVNRLAEWLSFLLKVQRSTAKRRAGAAPLKSCLYELWGERKLWEKGRLLGTQNVSLNKAGKTCKPLACLHSRLCGHKPIKVFTWGVLTSATLGPGVGLALFC